MRISLHGWMALAFFLAACEPEPCDLAPPEFEVQVLRGEGGGLHAVGDTVALKALPPLGDSVFSRWTGDIATIHRADTALSWLIMPHRPIQVAATYRALDRWPLSVVNGSGSGSYLAGSLVEIRADSLFGNAFESWAGDTALLADPRASATTLAMPAAAAQVEARYRQLPLYVLKVDDGSGSGDFPAGFVAPIGAGPAPAGFRFYDWQGDKQFVSQRRDSLSSVTMPPQRVSVWPRYIKSYLSGISYRLEIAPLIQANCATSACHDGSSSTLSDLTLYQELYDRSGSIRGYVLTGYMPPSAKMDSYDIQALVTWIDQGSPNN
jgi:hypothetical protein